MAAEVRDTLPMSVADMSFLIRKLGDDCTPLQFVRELTQNGIDAIRQSGGAGQVIWDANWPHFDLDSVYKLCCIDTGAGMTGPDMVKYINQLSSSIHQQSATGNFGVGAKIAAAPRNPHGMVYMSWNGGVGHMIHLWLDPEEKVFGLKRWPQNHGEFWTPVSDDLKPSQIDQHGTVVVLLGKSDEDNTMLPPPLAPMPSRWMLRYLNTRYFRFPTGVTVHQREGWEEPRTNSKRNFLRKVDGQGAWLDKNSEARGSVELVDATAHWWIIKAEKDSDSGHFAPGGHVAALYQDELYEMAISRAGFSRLQAFGIIFGIDRVVIYVEPKIDETRPVSANTARTHLLVGNESLDWAAWAGEFRNKMPEALVDLQESIGANVGEQDHARAISDRLKQIKDLLKFSRFRPSREGSVLVDPSGSATGGEPLLGGGTSDGSREAGRKGGRAGDIYALFAESGAVSADAIEGLSEPKVDWIYAEKKTRTPPDLEDRAARFLLQQNLLLINGDFRVFVDMTDRWSLAYAHVAGARTTIEKVVREWFQQQLVEAVMSAQGLRRTGRWSLQELEKLWSEDALTSAVLPRWHIDQSIKRDLGRKLGTLKASSSAVAAA